MTMKEAAPVGIVETTKEVIVYKHPENKNLYIYDLPGIGGSSRYSRENYVDAVQFSSYDFYVIISSTRFTELDVFLAAKVQDLGKNFYFVRSKIDSDLRNMKASHPITYDEQTILQRIRGDCIARLNDLGHNSFDVSKIFLVNHFEPNQHDFPKLYRNMVRDAPFIKINFRESMFSFAVCDFFGTMKEKSKIETGPLAMKSAIEGDVRIPSTPISIEISCIKQEIEKFKQTFSLQDKDILEYAELMNTSVKNMSKSLNLKRFEIDFTETGIIAACAELYPEVKLNWPLVGTFFSKRSVVKAYLENIIDVMADDAIKINLALISKSRNEYSQNSSTEV